MQIALIPHTHVHDHWPQVSQMLQRSLDTGYGEVSIDQLLMRIVNKEVHLFVFHDEQGVHGATTIEFLNYPSKRIALGGAFGGKDVCSQEHFDILKQWCRDMGASEYRTYAGEAQARLYSRIGMTKLYNVVGVDL